MKLIEFFSGVGFTSMALKKLVSFSHHRTSDWYIPSVISYAGIHYTKEDIENTKREILETMDKDTIVDVLFKMQVSTDGKAPMTMKKLEKKRVEWLANVYACFKVSNNLGSITEIKGKDLGIDNSKDKYLLSYSYPCFTSDSLVLTNSGYKRIVDLSTEDYVLTHTNTYKKVLNTFDNGMADVYTIKGMGNDEIKATSNHKFLVREMYRKGHLGVRTFREPKWKELKDLTKKDYLGVAINQNSIVPTWNGIDFIWTDGRKTRHKNQLSELMSNETFWWIVGRYIGDGWIRTGGGIIICCAKNETEEVTKKLDGVFHYTIANERTTNKIHIPLKELEKFVLQFGRGAANKRLTNTILDLPINLLKNFIEGYISADGSYDQNKRTYKAGSVSRELIYGIAQCIAKVYKTPYSIYKVIRPSKYIIEGRVVNQKPSWQIAYKVDKRKQDKAFYENGYIWYPIKTVEYFGKENVYDIEVEEDHSFTVQNTIVHNCQDLSLAGKGEGMSKGSGTRSGLLWEVERILLESSKIENGLPQVLCIAEGSQVYTKEGYKNIEDITINDHVLVENGTFQKVLFVKENGEKDVIQINAAGTIPFECTDDHKFLVAHPIVNPKRKGRNLPGKITEPKWIMAKDIKKGDKLCMPINKNSIIPKWCGVGSDTYRVTHKRKERNELKNKLNTEAFWYYIGRYLGDGWIVDYNIKNGDSVIICDKKENLTKLKKKVSRVFKCHGYIDTGVCKVQVCSGELVEFLRQFGRGSKGKRITKTIIDLPKQLLSAFLDGYIDSDGTINKKTGRITIGTVNKHLALGLTQCIGKLYGIRPTINYIKPRSSFLKSGLEIKSSGIYQVSFLKKQKTKIMSFKKGDKIWFQYKGSAPVGKRRTFDIGVNNIHSFTVNNVVVHNCMENVTQVHGKKHLADFEMWIKFLESLGYKNYWADLNAKHYGVPQNRDRTFMVSILGEHRYFMFPDKQLLKTKLKDILEKEVDEKYYLSAKIFEKLKDTSPIEGQNVNERFFKQAYETLETSTAKHGDTIDAFNEKLNVSGVSPTITTRLEGFKTTILPVIAASRGRNIENPSDRTKGIELEQRLEINKEGLSNTLTTVQKDNYVLETVFTETQARMITPDGNVRRYIDSEIVDKFEDGDCADISFPNGYNKGNRVFKQHAPTINTTTTQSSFIVKEEFTELQKKVAEEALKNNLLKPYDVIDYTYSNSRLSEIESGFIKTKNASDNNVMATLTTNAQNFGVCIGEQSKPKVKSLLRDIEVSSEPRSIGFRVRKLTPKECWRLMGATDEEFEKAEKGLRKYLYNGKDLTSSQLYHQAGNGIVVNVLVEIFKQILKSVGE